MINILKKDPVKRLETVLGRKKVRSSLIERKLYSYDATPIPIKGKVPLAVVFPEKAEDVIKLVEVCYEEGIPMFPRGAGSGLTGGAVPLKDKGIVVSFEKMTNIEIDIDNATVIAEPGVVTYELQKKVEKLGFFYPPDPSSYKYSTVGGNIAENAGGPRCLKYGVTREYVLGITAVIKEGKVLKTGNPVIKDVAGYDLTKFLVGSEGTLGLFTSAVLRLIPKPAERATILALFEDLKTVGKVVTEIMKSGVFPSALEFMDSSAIEAVERYKPLGLPKVEALLLIEVDGSPNAVKDQITEISSLLKKLKIGFEVAPDEKTAHRLWTARRTLGPALGNLKSGKINEDIVVPRTYLAEVLPLFKGVAKKYKLQVVIFGHIGDGNLHVNLLYDKSNTEEEKRAEKAVDEIFDITLSFKGSITGEHGVGITKKKFLKKQFGDTGYEILKGIKSLFDPKNLFNPGKVVDLEG